MQRHVFFDGLGSKALMDKILASLWPDEDHSSYAKYHHDVCPWPPDIFAYAMTYLLSGGFVRPSATPTEISRHIRCRNGKALGQSLYIVTVGDEIQIGVPPPSPRSPWWNSLGMKFVLIQPGEFLMGSPDSDSEATGAEKPQHRVRISQPFYLGVCPVTQAEYQQVMGINPSHFWNSGEAPVENVSWNEAQEFCQKLSAHLYRLPTEAEWEYACRAGSTTKYSFGDSESELSKHAWYGGNSGPNWAGIRQPNAWGLYDMHGNVWEWCADWYGAYEAGAVTDPRGPASGSHRVLRGGSFCFGHRYSTSASRFGHDPEFWVEYVGFRVVLVW